MIVCGRAFKRSPPPCTYSSRYISLLADRRTSSARGPGSRSPQRLRRSLPFSRICVCMFKVYLCICLFSCWVCLSVPIFAPFPAHPIFAGRLFKIERLGRTERPSKIVAVGDLFDLQGWISKGNLDERARHGSLLSLCLRGKMTAGRSRRATERIESGSSTDGLFVSASPYHQQKKRPKKEQKNHRVRLSGFPSRRLFLSPPFSPSLGATRAPSLLR